VHAFTEHPASLEDAWVVVLPAPYDLSLSWLPGARMGPEAILKASEELKLFDLELGFAPADAGIYTAPPRFPSSPATPNAPTRRSSARRGRTSRPAGSSSRSAVITRSPCPWSGPTVCYCDFGVIQLDAHDDLYGSWQGSANSHA